MTYGEKKTEKNYEVIDTFNKLSTLFVFSLLK